MSKTCPNCGIDHGTLEPKCSREDLFIRLVVKAMEVDAVFMKHVKAGRMPDVTIETSLAIVFAHIGRLVHTNMSDSKLPLRWLINKCLDKCEQNIDKIRTNSSMN